MAPFCAFKILEFYSHFYAIHAPIFNDGFSLVNLTSVSHSLLSRDLYYAFRNAQFAYYGYFTNVPLFHYDSSREILVF